MSLSARVALLLVIHSQDTQVASTAKATDDRQGLGRGVLVELLTGPGLRGGGAGHVQPGQLTPVAHPDSRSSDALSPRFFSGSTGASLFSSFLPAPESFEAALQIAVILPSWSTAAAKVLALLSALGPRGRGCVCRRCPPAPLPSACVDRSRIWTHGAHLPSGVQEAQSSPIRHCGHLGVTLWTPGREASWFLKALIDSQSSEDIF